MTGLIARNLVEQAYSDGFYDEQKLYDLCEEHHTAQFGEYGYLYYTFKDESQLRFEFGSSDFTIFKN